MTVEDSTKHILIESRERIVFIQMNRPEKKNAITRAMYRTMADIRSGSS
jgi:enoyl-CoA hydratase/carnithine racemase